MGQGKWGDDNRLDARRADAPDVPPQRGKRRKNRRQWCRGRTDIPHQFHVVLDRREIGWREKLGRPACYRLEWADHLWMCSHVERCEVCGKITRHGLDQDCPNFTPKVTIHKLSGDAPTAE